MQTITSSNNPKFRNAIRLHESRGRRQQGRMIIFGLNEIDRARQCGIKFVELYVCPEMMSDQARSIVADAQSHHSSNTYNLPVGLFQRIAFGSRADGLVVVADRPDTRLNKSSLSDNPLDQALILVLESIEKPGNMGAVFRSADAAGVTAIFVADPVSDVFHPNAIRASLGSVFAIDVFCDTSQNFREYLISRNFSITTARVNAQQNYFDLNMTGRCAIVLGNEQAGLSDFWSGPEVVAARIPMRGMSDSLNVAMTSTIMVFEARRQRSANETRSAD